MMAKTQRSPYAASRPAFSPPRSTQRQAQPVQRPSATLKTADEIAIMREAGRIVARAHEAMKAALAPGMTTAALDRIAETVIRDHGATPAFLNYPKPNSPNYPASINASINHEIVHGIPSEARVLKEGDIVSLDVGVIHQGYVGDSGWTYPVGEIAPAVKRLLDTAEQSLYLGIAAAVAPHWTRDIAAAIQAFVEPRGYSLVREYTGHGVGTSMHEEPQVPNWWPTSARQQANYHSVRLQPGMTLAIEPMVNAGRSQTQELDDKWTVITKDKSLSAHFEHTIAVTDGAPVILTLL